MAQSRFSSQYPDVREVFDFALANGGGKYTLPEGSSPVWWRQRAYTFRTKLRSELGGPTPYDGFTIRIEGQTCIITVNRPTGALATLDGSAPTEALSPSDPLVQEAEALRRTLNLKVDL